MELTKHEISQLKDRHLPKIIREQDPQLQPGDRIVVAYSKPRRHADPTDGHVFDAPAEPVLWITVTKVVRHRSGGFLVRYDVTDNRQEAWMMRRGYGYTTSLKDAVDRDEAHLTDKDRQRLSTEARARRAEARKKSEEERRRQERAIRDRLRECMAGLTPEAQAALLAGIEREIRKAQMGDIGKAA